MWRVASTHISVDIAKVETQKGKATLEVVVVLLKIRQSRELELGRRSWKVVFVRLLLHTTHTTTYLNGQIVAPSKEKFIYLYLKNFIL